VSSEEHKRGSETRTDCSDPREMLGDSHEARVLREILLRSPLHMVASGYAAFQSHTLLARQNRLIVQHDISNSLTARTEELSSLGFPAPGRQTRIRHRPYIRNTRSCCLPSMRPLQSRGVYLAATAFPSTPSPAPNTGPSQLTRPPHRLAHDHGRTLLMGLRGGQYTFSHA
jgi:hypothetical protein